jgi:hypothetical protein
VEPQARRAPHIVKGTPTRDDELMGDVLDIDINLSLCEENARLRRLVVELSAMVLRCIAVQK